MKLRDAIIKNPQIYDMELPNTPPKPRTIKNEAERSDGFLDSVVGHGTSLNNSLENSMFAIPFRMADQFLSNIFIGNSLARKIVSLPADEATKHWISIPADKNGFAAKMLDNLGAEEKFADAVRWSRLYGGSAILMLANDGGTLEDPLDEKNIKEIEQLRVYDKTQIFWNDAVLYDDPQDCKYGQPQYYEINPIGGIPFLVHETRLLLFTGDPIPDYYRVANQGWGLPALQGMTEEIANNQNSMKLAIEVMKRKGQAILKLDGLLDVLDLGEEGTKQVKDRLDLIDMARNVLNTIAIDGEDDFTIENLSISGMADLIDRFGFALSAAANIPFVILFSHNPKGSGLAQSGGTDLENWYNFVSQIQKRLIKKPLYRLILLLMLSKSGKFGGKELENWDITFNPLWSPSELEQAQAEDANADANFKNAQANVLQIQNKIISAAECQRQAGFNSAEIKQINKEISQEAKQSMNDILGHSFGNNPQDTTLAAPVPNTPIPPTG